MGLAQPDAPINEEGIVRTRGGLRYRQTAASTFKEVPNQLDTGL